MNSTLDNGLRILERLASEPREFSITEIGRELCLGKSMVHRLLTTLIERGYVAQNPKTSRYSVALKVVELSSGVLGMMPLRHRAGPYVRHLADLTNKTAYLGVPHRGTVLVIAVSYPRGVVRADEAQLGRTMPMHVSAMGKALLAYREDLAAEIVKGAEPLPRVTDRTITDPEQFRAELARIRREGVALTLGEHGASTAGVAAVVCNREGVAEAGIGVAMPLGEYRENPAEAERIRDAVRETALSVSFALGYEKAYLQSVTANREG